MADDSNSENAPNRRLSRRRALARLGLAIGATYAAPTVIGLNRAAADNGDDGGDGGDDGPPWGRDRHGHSKHRSSKGKNRD